MPKDLPSHGQDRLLSIKLTVGVLRQQQQTHTESKTPKVNLSGIESDCAHDQYILATGASK